MCKCGCDGPINGLADSVLQPIRDQPGEDETIQWTGLPGEIEINCNSKQGEKV